MPYDPTLPTDKDKARWRIGDTAAVEELTDDHIESVLTQEGFTLGLSKLADELALIFAKKPNSVSKSGKSVSWADRVGPLQKLAAQLRGEAGAEDTSGRNATSRARNIVVW